MLSGRAEKQHVSFGYKHHEVTIADLAETDNKKHPVTIHDKLFLAGKIKWWSGYRYVVGGKVYWRGYINTNKLTSTQKLTKMIMETNDPPIKEDKITTRPVYTKPLWLDDSALRSRLYVGGDMPINTSAQELNDDDDENDLEDDDE
jgi:hypothetical protein